MRTPFAPSLLLVPLFLALPLAGCDLEDFLQRGFDAGTLDACTDAPTPDLSGRWTLEGGGTRSHCSDARYDGTFRLHSAATLTVTQPAVDGGTQEELPLSLVDAPEGLDFDGQVRGSCVRFEVEEAAGEGLGTVRYTFEGTWTGEGRPIRGTLEGFGPQSCAVSGQFELTVD